MRLLDKRVAWVTGGSRGLGRTLAVTLAREGARVAFNYSRSKADADATLEAIVAVGGEGLAFQTSVLDAAGLSTLVQELERSWGQVDILVNNAGLGQAVPVALMEEEDWDQMMDVHVKGAFLSCRAVLRTMIKARYGRILNIGSLAGVKMMEAPVHYSSAKAALKGLTESLAKEVGRYGITVNCLAPGILEEGVSRNVPAPRLEEYLRHCALRRPGTFQECAEVAAFLVAERNSYMNGATVVLDGGV